MLIKKIKVKIRKSALKRVKIKNKCIYTKKANKGHLLRKKNSKRLRRLSTVNKLSNADIKIFKKMLQRP